MTPPADIRWLRLALLVCGAVALYYLGLYVSDLVIEELTTRVRGDRKPLMHGLMMTATGVYIALMAIPFMPGVEIGLSLLMIFGAKSAYLVYVSTVVALILSYGVGRLLPPKLAAKAVGLLGLTKARDLVNRLATLSRQEQMSMLVRDSSLARLVPYLEQYRYLALAVAINVPGNIVLGGGGGIALLTGMTRMFSFPMYFLTVALAVAPVPLFVSFTG